MPISCLPVIISCKCHDVNRCLRDATAQQHVHNKEYLARESKQSKRVARQVVKTKLHILRVTHAHYLGSCPACSHIATMFLSLQHVVLLLNVGVMHRQLSKEVACCRYGVAVACLQRSIGLQHLSQGQNQAQQLGSRLDYTAPPVTCGFRYRFWFKVVMRVVYHLQRVTCLDLSSCIVGCHTRDL